MYGKKIKDLIERNGLLQKEFSALINVPQSSMSQWIKQSFPPLDFIAKVCEYFDIPLWQFFAPENTVLPDLNPIDSKYLYLFQQVPEELQALMMATSAKIVEAYNIGKSSK
jgi:transcriptional regulator with XRE-family HTH domain